LTVVVDGLALDDAVQVEHNGLDAQEDGSPHDDRLVRGDSHRHDRVAIGWEGGEVAVVAGCEYGATDGGRDEAVGGVCRVDGEGEHRRELLREHRHAERAGIDARELGGILEAAEAAVALVEEPANRGGRDAARADDLAAHGGELGHDPLLWTWAVDDCDCEKVAPLSSKNELLEEDELDVAAVAWVLWLVDAWWLVPGCAARAAIAIPRKAMPAATPIDLRVVRSRRLASPMRDPLSMGSSFAPGPKTALRRICESAVTTRARWDSLDPRGLTRV
jgi:hypothetical protein